jgi:hypothetical protein
LPTTREGDLDIITPFPARGALAPLPKRLRGSGRTGVLKDFRIIVNYELDLL